MYASELANLLINTMAQHRDMPVFVEVNGQKVKAVVYFDDCRDINGTRFIALTLSDVERDMQDLKK